MIDSGTLALITTLAVLVGGAIGWFFRQYWQYRSVKREASLDANRLLKEQKAQLEEMITKTDDDIRKKELCIKRDEINEELRGLLSVSLRRTLKDAGFPTEEILVLEGRRQLQPEQVIELKEEIEEVESLPPSVSIQELLTLANAYYYAEQYEDAKNLYDKILQLNPNDPVTLNNRGAIYEHMEKYDEALANYNRSLELKPDEPSILNNRGNAYGDLGKYDESLADYNRSLELRPDHPTTLYNRGNTYNELEKYDEALADFNHSLEFRPNDPDTLNNRGVTYAHMKKYDEALANYNRSLELRPNHPTTLNNRGSTYTELKKYEKALADFNRSLGLRPDHPDTIYNRGTTYANLERYDESFADFNRSLELRPDDPGTLFNLACLFSLWGKTDNALPYLEKAIHKDKKYREDAKTDEDFDNIRKDPRFKKLIGED